MIAFLGLLIGIIIGMVFKVNIPTKFSPYLSVAILACLDSVFGAIRALLAKNFEADIFVSGFFGNALLAAALAYLGDKMGVPIYLAAVVVFGGRIFNNFAIIRRLLIEKAKGKWWGDKLRRNESTIFVFIAAIFLGLLITLNLSTKSTNTTIQSAKEYQEAYNERTNLISDIDNLQDKYNEIYSKLYSYKYDNDSETKITQQLQEEINNNNMIIGKTALQGEGIKITITDVSVQNLDGVLSNEEYMTRLIHDSDLVQLVNDLKNGGAEAISVNDQRIVSTSDLFCGGSYISINGVKVPGPYYINAIGNKDVLKSYMELDQNYVKFLRLRHITVDVQQYDNIKVPAFDGDIKIKNLK